MRINKIYIQSSDSSLEYETSSNPEETEACFSYFSEEYGIAENNCDDTIFMHDQEQIKDVHVGNDVQSISSDDSL